MNPFVPFVVVIFLFLPFSEALPKSFSVAWTYLVFGVLISCVVFGKLRRPIGRRVWLAAAYLATAGVISAYVHADFAGAHIRIGAQIVAFLAVGPYALRYLASVDGLRAKAISAFIVGQTISSGAAIAQAGGMTLLGVTLLNGRTPGFAGHPNILGVLSGVTAIVLIHLMFTLGKWKLLLFLLLVVNVFALAASGSISALIALAVGMAVYMVSARVSFRIPALIVGGIATVLWVLGQVDKNGLIRGTADRISQVTGQTGDISTLDIRQNTYAFAWEGIKKDPFYGRGLDDSSGATFDSFTLTHNMLLRSWFQGGLPMALAFVLVIGAVVVLIVRALQRGTDSASAGVLAVIIGFSMTSASLQQGYFWLLVLGALSLVEPRTSGNSSEVSRRGIADANLRPSIGVGGTTMLVRRQRQWSPHTNV